MFHVKEPKFFVGTIYNDEEILNRILMVSSPNGLRIYPIQADCATDGLNSLLEISEAQGADVAIICHQDIYLPPGWFAMLARQLNLLPTNWVVAGIYGVNEQGKHHGRIHDRRSPLPLIRGTKFPEKALSIDACVMIFNTKMNFRFEKIEGFDLYDTYAVLKAREIGGTAWIIDCLADHYCIRPVSWKPDAKFLKVWDWLKQRFPDEKIISTCYEG